MAESLPYNVHSEGHKGRRLQLNLVSLTFTVDTATVKTQKLISLSSRNTPPHVNNRKLARIRN